MGRVFWDPFRPLTLAKPFFSNREKGGFGAILEYRRLSQGWGCVGVWYCPGTLKRKEPVTKHLQNGIENPPKKEVGLLSSKEISVQGRCYVSFSRWYLRRFFFQNVRVQPFCLKGIELELGPVLQISKQVIFGMIFGTPNNDFSQRMFGEPAIFYVMTWSHPTETSTFMERMSRVPGSI